MAPSTAPPSPTAVSLSKPVFYEPSVRHNASVISSARSSSAAVAGIAAGVLGLTGFSGFAFYALVSVVVGGFIYGLKLDLGAKQTEKYFRDWKGPWVDEVAGNALSFVLFWTLCFSLVHIYE